LRMVTLTLILLMVTFTPLILGYLHFGYLVTFTLRLPSWLPLLLGYLYSWLPVLFGYLYFSVTFTPRLPLLLLLTPGLPLVTFTHGFLCSSVTFTLGYLYFGHLYSWLLLL